MVHKTCYFITRKLKGEKIEQEKTWWVVKIIIGIANDDYGTRYWDDSHCYIHVFASRDEVVQGVIADLKECDSWILWVYEGGDANNDGRVSGTEVQCLCANGVIEKDDSVAAELMKRIEDSRAKDVRVYNPNLPPEEKSKQSVA